MSRWRVGLEEHQALTGSRSMTINAERSSRCARTAEPATITSIAAVLRTERPLRAQNTHGLLRSRGLGTVHSDKLIVATCAPRHALDVEPLVHGRPFRRLVMHLGLPATVRRLPVSRLLAARPAIPAEHPPGVLGDPECRRAGKPPHCRHWMLGRAAGGDRSLCRVCDPNPVRVTLASSREFP